LALSRLSDCRRLLSGRLGRLSDWRPRLSGFLGRLSDRRPQLSDFLGQLSGFLGRLSGYLGQLSGYLGQLSGNLGRLFWLPRRLSGFLGRLSDFLGQLSVCLRQLPGILPELHRRRWPLSVCRMDQPQFPRVTTAFRRRPRFTIPNPKEEDDHENIELLAPTRAPAQQTARRWLAAPAYDSFLPPIYLQSSKRSKNHSHQSV